MTDSTLHLRPTGAILAKNTFYNLVGRSLPLLTGLIAMPVLIHRLGVERFGMLMLVWTIINYSTLFDVGLGRATTRYVAHDTSSGNVGDLPALIWTSWLGTFGLGAAAGLAIALTAPTLTSHIFRVPQGMIGEANLAFYCLAGALPFVLVTAPARGVLEARQRFDIVNAVQSPAGVATYLVPLLVSLGTQDLGAVVVALVSVRMLAVTAYIACDLRLIPELRRKPQLHRDFLRVMKFGGWVTVSGVVSPVLEYVDRLLIGGLITIAAVAYYATPYAMVSQVHAVSGSFLAVLFPALSGMIGERDRDAAARLYCQSVKYVFLLIAPFVLVFATLAQDIMSLWIGAEFAEHSHIAMRILSLGVLVNALARVPFSLLQAAGHPDVPARFHMVEVGPFVLLSWGSIMVGGLTGAAVAWTSRATVDAALLYWAADRSLGRRGLGLKRAALMTMLATMVICAAWVVVEAIPWLACRFALVALLLLVAVCAVWRFYLDPSERQVVKRWCGTAVRVARNALAR